MFDEGEFASRGVCIQGDGSASRGRGLPPGGFGSGSPHRILRDTVNVRSVRILLECIIVKYKITVSCMHKIITDAVRFNVLFS